MNKIKNKDLNRLIAQNVMGWQEESLPNFEGSAYKANFWVNQEGEKMYPVNFFKPSSELGKITKIAEEKGLFNKFALHKKHNSTNQEALWHVSKINDKGILENFVSSANASRVLCEALLKIINHK